MTHRAQMLMKSRLAGAQKGHGLLKKKADALQMRFRQILGKIIEVSSKFKISQHFQDEIPSNSETYLHWIEF